VTSITVFATPASFIVLDNLIVDGESGASVVGIAFAGARRAGYRLKVQNTTVNGFLATGGSTLLVRCEATGCSGTAAFNFNTSNGHYAIDCEAYGNTVPGFVVDSTPTLIRCIASGNTGASTDGFQCNSLAAVLDGCVSYGNGRHGFNFTVSGSVLAQNCIAEANVNTGFSANAVYQELDLLNCAAFGNTTADYNTTNIPNRTDCLTGSAGYFVNAASGDFALNTTSGGGAAARAAGYPGTLPRGTTVGYRDIGTAQHQDTGGGAVDGAPAVLMNGWLAR
jgi:hypothetical protein